MAEATAPGRTADATANVLTALVGRRARHDVGHQRSSRRGARPLLPHPAPPVA